MRNLIRGFGWVLAVSFVPDHFYPLVHLASTIAVPYYFSGLLEEKELFGVTLATTLLVLLPIYMQRLAYGALILGSLLIEGGVERLRFL